MIARIWRGAVRKDDGDEYATYMEDTGIAGYRSTPGNQVVLTLRRDIAEKTEFLMLTIWDSLDSIKAFAGEEPEKAVFFPEDDRFLIERDWTATRYQAQTAAGLSPDRGERAE